MRGLTSAATGPLPRRSLWLKNSGSLRHQLEPIKAVSHAGRIRVVLGCRRTGGSNVRGQIAPIGIIEIQFEFDAIGLARDGAPKKRGDAVGANDGFDRGTGDDNNVECL